MVSPILPPQTPTSESPAACQCCGASPIIHVPNLTPRSARITDLLNSNSCPLHLEELSFRAEVPERQRRICNLDEAIHQARRALQSLIHQRHQEVRDLNDIQTVMHPIRRMPADVMREIFLTCLEDQDPRADSLDTNGMPWVLVQVCSQWRQVAISYARLWSRVHVNFDTLALHPHPERLVHVLWLQLSRSQQYRLDMELSSSIHISEMHPILPTLLGSSNRWRTLSLDMTDPSVRNVLAPAYGKLQTLQLVNIKSSGLSIEEDVGFDVLSDLRSAPALRSLHVLNSPLSLAVPWGRLEEYVCHRPDFGVSPSPYMADPTDMLDNNLALLKKLRSVQTFKTRFTARSPPTLRDQPLKHEHLKSLWLEAPASPLDIGVSEFLKMVNLPNLRSLGWLRRSDMSSTLALLRRSGCTLTTIGIIPETFSPGLRDLLRYTSTVETLALKHDVVPAFWSALQGDRLLPHLVTLDMSEVSPGSISEDRLWRVVKTRRNLQEVRLPPGFEPSVSLEEQYASFIKAGLIIGTYYS